MSSSVKSFLSKRVKGKRSLTFLNIIDEAEGFAIAPLVVSADGFSRVTRTNVHLVVMLLAKGKVSLITFLEAKDVDVGVDGGGLTQCTVPYPGVD